MHWKSKAFRMLLLNLYDLPLNSEAIFVLREISLSHPV